MKLHRMILITVLSSLGVTGCADTDSESVSSPDPPDNGWLLASAPDGAVPVTEAKTNAESGERITVLGRIGGRRQPISNDSPVFLIVDLALPHCGENPADSCPTPWDYCCEPGDLVAANSATVQLVGEDGSPLDVDPIAGGLSPLDEVVVVGDVAERTDGGSLTIRATGVHVR